MKNYEQKIPYDWFEIEISHGMKLIRPYQETLSSLKDNFLNFVCFNDYILSYVKCVHDTVLLK